MLTRDEIGDIVHRSELISHYNRDIDRESAHEILLEKMEEQDALEEKARRKAGTQGSTTRSRSTRQVSTFERIMKSPLTRTVAREVTRECSGHWIEQEMSSVGYFPLRTSNLTVFARFSEELTF